MKPNGNKYHLYGARRENIIMTQMRLRCSDLQNDKYRMHLSVDPIFLNAILKKNQFTISFSLAMRI